MNLQIGTVDGLVNITPKAIFCFVNAINAFSKGGVEYAREANVSFGMAFQRFVEPVYTGIKEDFDLKDIFKPAYTTNNKEQSPARVTFCKKMGLLKIDDSNDVFELTPLAEEIRLKRITIEEYAFILLTKQGIFIDGNYVCNLFSLIAQRFEESTTISDIEILDYIKEKFEDADIEKTRADIIINALCTTGLIAKITKGVYVLSNTLYAEIFKDFQDKSYLLSPAYIDKDDAYIEYMGEMKYGIFDVINNDNKDIYLRKFPNLIKYVNLNKDIMNKENISQKPINEPLQQIFYGAPGTGKSHWIKKRLKELEVSKENIFRTTFHPDSDYSTFVGAYKPTMKKQYRYDGKVKAKYYEDDDLADAKKDDVIIDTVIQYDFIPQTFVKAYVRAYKTTDNVYLVIEEINRGNCAQIFGDLFQLLDRDENGISEYTIKADTDLRTYLEDALGKDADGIKDGELCLPSNLYIWATMNTSDQSLFPIDSAFKRRWDWKYEPIKYENTNWKIEIGGTKYLWTDFQRKVNSRIFDDTSSEDKMLGDYFVNPPTGIISKDLFLNKILFYLWNDVCKDGDGDIFKSDDDKDIKFSDLYGSDGTSKLFSMMRHLKVKPIDGTSDDNDEDDEDDAEGSTSKRYSINGEVTNKDGKKWGKGTLVKRAVEIYCEKHPSETAEQIRDAWMSLGFKIPHLIETKDDKEKRLTDSRDKTGRERAREIILSNGESIYVSTEVGSGAVLDGFGDFLTKIQSKPEWGISIQEL